MKLLIVRHADAGDRDDFAKSGKPDSERPLSKKGREQMEGVTKGLRRLVDECDVVGTSPYTRAVQTAEYLRDGYGSKLVITETLEPDTSPAEFEAWLRKLAAEVVIAVGHEPDLGALATWLLTGSDSSHIEFKKAGACLLEFSGPAKRGTGTLKWLMGAKDLDAVGRRG